MVEEEHPSEPIIELPESPSPPPEPVSNDDDEEEEDNGGVKCHEQKEENVSSESARVGNILGVQPRKPIRAHHATTGRSGHSTKRFGSLFVQQRSPLTYL